MSDRVCPRCGGTGMVRDDATIGSELRERRKAARLSAKTVASGMNLSPQYLADLEKGRRRWSPELIQNCEAVIRVLAWVNNEGQETLPLVAKRGAEVDR